MADDYGILGQGTGNIQHDLDWLMYGTGGALWLDSLTATQDKKTDPCRADETALSETNSKPMAVPSADLLPTQPNVSQSETGYFGRFGLLGVAQAASSDVEPLSALYLADLDNLPARGVSAPKKKLTFGIRP